MFKIKHIKIMGFWGKHILDVAFYNDVNVIIGKNGTGKTTFMSILHAVLTVDVEWLYDFEFEFVEIKLVLDKKIKTIKVKKSIPDDYKFPIVEYYVSRKNFKLRVIGTDDAVPLHFRRRIVEESEEIRKELGGLVNITTLSVYRIKKDYEYDRRERAERRNISPIDLILQDLLQRLTTYQLELSDQARQVSSKLQKEVLSSLLYIEERENKQGIKLDFDKREEKKKLITAYNQLGVLDSKIRGYIDQHVEKVSESIEKMKLAIKSPDAEKMVALDFGPLEKIRLTNDVVKMSLKAEEEEKSIFRQQSSFIKILHEFILDKKFSFKNGLLKVEKNGDVPIPKLSSGEKQLIILFAEALLQREQSFIFVADEPELSLHISWQREILPAIRTLNPNAQLIVATHSPEIAGKYVGKILDMEDVLQ
ncbi:AAA family ATPase [Thiothrix subterranea]|uniref:AAA family ATPase n=1 Tax=Thiothrix subterranea TaxID=2735563 RepID=A0AA51QXU7_9GAMM|nr:AAA family ATPase [Thiothrix subterranea]MDQ5768101.1 AAA family ATPase [Thiothrix subterranea]WML85282.1 AAA family ATPase [Thiothrix subterranea]